MFCHVGVLSFIVYFPGDSFISGNIWINYTWFSDVSQSLINPNITLQLFCVLRYAYTDIIENYLI